MKNAIIEDDVSFCKFLASQFPGIGQLFSEHLTYYEELLPHVFMGDVTRYVLEGGPDRAQVVQFFEEALAGGETAVEELIAVSFVENIETREYLGRVLAGVSGHCIRDEWMRQHGD